MVGMCWWQVCVFFFSSRWELGKSAVVQSSMQGVVVAWCVWGSNGAGGSSKGSGTRAKPSHGRVTSV